MEFVAVSETRIIILMLVGLLFAGAGVYLLLKPKQHGASKIEMMGMKFESSSAGLWVFLVGAVFLIVPLFVPEKDAPETALMDVPLSQDQQKASPSAPSAPEPADTSESSPSLSAEGVAEESGATRERNGSETLEKQTETGSASSRIQRANLIEETEPNDSLRTAMPIAINQTVLGRVERNVDRDWYVLEIPQDGITGHEVRLFHVGGTGSVRAHMYNARQEKVGWLETNDGAQYLEITSSFSDRVYFQVERYNFGPWGEYELSLISPDNS